ncbi:calcium/sodium antiporter [Aliidiomarina maris]|uniref:Calcium/sodium antiporter n=1 Tax=Aliidiomarina maris TaxID=531312 RepID=A0A327XAX8_9GAMM|nr:calcium/sodium antiporter [Aliidiomarina maris]RAK00827.1 cation:H+ antiporter [Aliidiomarina maris]RUO27184.1 calcium/sodium antiporter [Aliidiomarina maris]
MLLPAIAILAGLALLTWSADKFVDGASSTARHLGMSPLLIGMLIIGFGTSAPEMVVSAMAAIDGAPNLALGNAYGSNIANIALVLGLTAVIAPIAVSSKIIRREIPLLIVVMIVAGWQLQSGLITRWEAWILLGLFFAFMGWAIYQGRNHDDVLGSEAETELDSHAMPLGRAILWLIIGLLVLVASSRLLVWGAVDIATSLGVSELVIGLTIVAIGTSLPELASCVAAVRKKEHDLALGNILGSNMFNTLAVVGIAGAITPIEFDYDVFTRDWSTMMLLTVVLVIFGLGRGGKGRINRIEGGVLLILYAAYMVWLFTSAASGTGA